MARYGTRHKQVTRQRTIEAAGRRLRRDGIDGSGIATVMADAGLTNGAFYAHFESKEDLFANALVEQLRAQRESLPPPGNVAGWVGEAKIAGHGLAVERSFSSYPPDRAGLEQIVREYLSVQHRDNPQAGCASAALVDEIGRSSEVIKRAYAEGLLTVIDDIAARVTSDNPQSARNRHA